MSWRKVGNKLWSNFFVQRKFDEFLGQLFAESTVVSTSTRNFPNRLGDGANVFLASAELAAISATLGYIPTIEEYNEFMSEINTMGPDVYRYLNFHEIASYKEAAKNVVLPTLTIEEVKLD